MTFKTTLSADSATDLVVMNHLEHFKSGKGFQARSLEIRRLMIIGLQADKCQNKSVVSPSVQTGGLTTAFPGPSIGKVFSIPGADICKYSFSKLPKTPPPFTNKPRGVFPVILPEVIATPDLHKSQVPPRQKQLPIADHKNEIDFKVALIENIAQTGVALLDNEQSLVPGVLDSVSSLFAQSTPS